MENSNQIWEGLDREFTFRRLSLRCLYSMEDIFLRFSSIWFVLFLSLQSTYTGCSLWKYFFRCLFFQYFFQFFGRLDLSSRVHICFKNHQKQHQIQVMSIKYTLNVREVKCLQFTFIKKCENESKMKNLKIFGMKTYWSELTFWILWKESKDVGWMCTRWLGWSWLVFEIYTLFAPTHVSNESNMDIFYIFGECV